MLCLPWMIARLQNPLCRGTILQVVGVRRAMRNCPKKSERKASPFLLGLTRTVVNRGKDAKTIQGLLRHAKVTPTLDLYSQSFDAAKLETQEEIAVAIRSAAVAADWGSDAGRKYMPRRGGYAGCCLALAGTLANRKTKPSAVVGWVKIASRSTVYGNPPSIAV